MGIKGSNTQHLREHLTQYFGINMGLEKDTSNVSRIMGPTGGRKELQAMSTRLIETHNSNGPYGPHACH